MEKKVKFSIVMVVMYGMVHPSSTCPRECACSENRVDCYGRHLQTIPDDIPESTTNLDLHNNEIREVDAEKFSQLQELVTLSLNINHLTELKSLVFVNLTKLTKLQVGNNEIETLGDNVFTGLVSLQDLDLINNKLTEITGKFIIPSLRRLTLSQNQITSLEDNTLNGVRNLYNLILSNNKISYISRLAMKDMIHLSYLALDGNPIKNVDHTFESMERLSNLDVSSCRLRNFPIALPWVLRRLKISNNSLTVLASQDLYSTRHLEFLILDNNKIQTIQDGALLYTPYLKEVHISQNKILWLPQIPKNIEILIADDNDIHRLYQSNFAHDSAMKTLSLSNNKISEIAANTFSRLTNLSTLLLGNNAITDLRNMTFAGLRQLITLNLEYNPVEKIESRAFGGLQKLQQLTLANTYTENSKTMIEGVIFQDTPSLSYLDLQGSASIINDILNSSELLRSLGGIQHLNLMNGSLETLSKEIRSSLPNLKSLNLSANPWKCDAELAGLRKWIIDSPALFQNSKILCASPDRLRGKPVQDVSIEELRMLEITSSFSSSYTPEITFNTATVYYQHLQETETTNESHLIFVTELSELPTKIMETTLPVPNDIISSVLELTSPATSYNHTLSTGQMFTSTSTPSLTPLSIMTPLLTSSSEQLFPSTTSDSLTMSVAPTEALATSVLYLTAEATQSNSAAIRSFTWVKSNQWTQVSANNAFDDLQATPSAYIHADSQSTLSDSVTSTSHFESTLHPTSIIISQPISRIILTASLSQPQAWPISVIPTQLSINITHFETPTTLMFSAEETSITSRIRQLTDQSLHVEFSSNLETTKSNSKTWLPSREPDYNLTSMSESTALQETTQIILDNQSTNSTDSERNIKSSPVKTPVKTDNRLPALSNSADTKLRAIIITVSIFLLALVVGLFIVVAIVRYCKKRKHVSFEDHSKHMVEFQTETSDTAFIISHMEGEQTGHLTADTTRDCATNPVSLKDITGQESNSKQTKTASKFNKQCQSTSTVISTTNFDCIKDETEDDSELLMDAWN